MSGTINNSMQFHPSVRCEHDTHELEWRFRLKKGMAMNFLSTPQHTFLIYNNFSPSRPLFSHHNKNVHESTFHNVREWILEAASLPLGVKKR